jgi:hypothetical protein
MGGHDGDIRRCGARWLTTPFDFWEPGCDLGPVLTRACTFLPISIFERLLAVWAHADAGVTRCLQPLR